MYNILGAAQQMEKLNSKKSPTRKKKKKKNVRSAVYTSRAYRRDELQITRPRIMCNDE